MRKIVPCTVINRVRPGSYQAHIPAHHIPELRKLVQTVTAENSPDPGDARIVAQLEAGTLTFIQPAQLLALAISIAHHRAELVAAKPLSFSADTFGGVNRWPAGIEPNEDCNK